MTFRVEPINGIKKVLKPILKTWNSLLNFDWCDMSSDEYKKIEEEESFRRETRNIATLNWRWSCGSLFRNSNWSENFDRNNLEWTFKSQTWIVELSSSSSVERCWNKKFSEYVSFFVCESFRMKKKQKKIKQLRRSIQNFHSFQATKLEEEVF